MACTADCKRPTPGQAHCGACHRTFTGVSNFDLHRRAGICTTPAGMTERNGLWGLHGSMTAEEVERRNRARAAKALFEILAEGEK